MARTKLTRRNIAGKVIRYKDWRAEVVRLADERQIPDAIRDQVHEAMLLDGWEKGEFPARFLDTVVACFSEETSNAVA